MPSTRSGRLTLLVALLLVAQFVARGVGVARSHAVTIDEYGHLPAGLRHLTAADFGAYYAQPPLARMLEAVPVWLAMDPIVPTRLGPPEQVWQLGAAFQDANRGTVHRQFVIGRMATLALGALGLSVVFLWARRVWGDRGGLLALAVASLDPNLVAHSSLVTVDAGLCTFGLLGLFAVDRLLAAASTGTVPTGSLPTRRSPTRAVLVAGVAIGLAQLTKLTALFLYPVSLLALAVVPKERRRGAFGRLLAAWGISLVVLNAGYLFQGTLQPLDQFTLRSSLMRRLQRLPIPVPVPADYLIGFDLIQAYGEQGYPAYLNGHHYRRGAPWFYDLESIALKTPVVELLLVLVALVWVPRWAGGNRVSLALWLLTCGLFIVVTSSSRIDAGLRYLLILFPLGAMLVGGLARRAPRAVWAAVLLLAWESWSIHPHEIAYFNVLAGGPHGGRRYLAGSQLDIGQDLPALAECLQRFEVTGLRLAYHGRVDPTIYGIDYELAVPPFAAGWYGISANYLIGGQYHLFDPVTRTTRWSEPDAYAPFREIEPVAHCGPSIDLFRVP